MKPPSRSPVAGRSSSSEAWSADIRLGAEALHEHAVPEAAVTHSQGLRAELRQHGADDARAGENDLRPVRLQADDLAALGGGAGAIELELPVDLRNVEDGALDDVGVVRRE